MKRQTLSDIVLPDEHMQPLTGLRELAKVLVDGGQPDTAKAIEALTREAQDSLQDLWQQALSVADANAGAIELVEQQMRFNEELKQQNLQLREQKQQIDKALKDLEDQAAAIAEANVDAILQAEESVDVVQINGERVRGLVVGFDTYGILLETEDKNACFLFKHGVSAIHGGKDLLRRRKPTEGNDS